MGSLRERLKGAGGRPVMMGASLLTAIFNTVALLLIARQAGPEILGSLGFLLAFMGLSQFAGDLGYGLAFERLLARGYGFHSCYRAFMTAKLKFTVGMGILSGILMAAYIYILAPAGHTPVSPVSLALFLGYFLVLNLSGIWVVSMRLRERRAAPNDLIESFVKALLVSALFSMSVIRGDQDLVFKISFIYLLAATLGMMLVRNSARGLKAGGADEEIEVEFQDTSRKFVPYLAIMALMANLDKVALWLASDFHTLGIYFGAQRITVFIASSAVMIEVMLGKALTGHIRNHRDREISETLCMTERYVSLVVLPITAFYVVFSDSLLQAFLGPNFAGAGIVVSLLAGAGLLGAMASPHLSYLLRADRLRELGATAGVGFGIFLAALAILLPGEFVTYEPVTGMNGAATAILLSSIAMYAMARFHVWKLLGCKPHRSIPAHFLSAGIMMAVMQFVIWYFGITLTFPWLMILAIMGFLLYVMGLYLTGEMVRRDFLEFRRLTGSE